VGNCSVTPSNAATGNLFVCAQSMKAGANENGPF
jgi:hypothetical protein